MKGLYIALAFIVIALFFGITKHNSLVKAHQQVQASWADVESTLQRRFDLIPNLVNTVKGYATHEKETLEGVTNMRAEAYKTTVNVDLTDPASMMKLASMQGELSGALGKLFAVAENYPDLKASQNFLDLQSQLEGTENRINVARTRYNGEVSKFNAAILTFPGNIVNGMLLGYKEFSFFKADERAQNAPSVNFN